MKYIYALCCLKKDNELSHIVYEFGENINLLCLKDIPNIYAFNIYPKEKAYKFMNNLNDDAKKQNRYNPFL